MSSPEAEGNPLVFQGWESLPDLEPECTLCITGCLCMELGAASQLESQALWQGRREALGLYADLFARKGASHAELAACDALLHGSGAPPLPPSVRSIMAECNGFGLPGFGALSFSPSVTLLQVSSLPHVEPLDACSLAASAYPLSVCWY